MKPVAAIVEAAAIDVDLLEKQLAVEIAGARDDAAIIERYTGQLERAHEVAKARRLRIGALFVKIRGAWPASGPKARGWSEMLTRLRMDDSTAVRYMNEFRNPDSAQTRAGSQRGDRDTKPANVHGGSGEKPRGAYCTPKKYADAVGPWDLDPFSNPQSHIVASARCMLENGGNGLADLEQPGSFIVGGCEMALALETTRVFIQPDYRIVMQAIAHYGHTRFCALLRWAPDTRWFKRLWPLVHVVAFPLERIPFETPDGVVLEGADDEDEDRGAPFPHAFYYANERDVTDAIRALCIVLRVEHPNT